MTEEEFSQRFLLSVPYRKGNYDNTGVVTADVDWDSKGAVSPVRDQGGCSASYAFSAVAAI